MIHVCAVCGTSFKKRGNRKATYCSRECWNIRPLVPLAERLWRNVDKSSGPEACWPWLASVTPTGYGMINRGDQKCIGTHVAAWIVSNGAIPLGMQVCHSCDNPPCCNPSHLWLGTFEDNMADKVAKGRCAKGSRHGNSKLSESDAAMARDMRASGMLYSDIAKKFNVTEGTIRYAVRSGWAHVDANIMNEYTARRKSHGDNHPKSKLTGAIVSEARQRRSSGESIASIARSIGVGFGAARCMLMRTTWKHVP